MRERGWGGLIAKPCVGATARDTFLLDSAAGGEDLERVARVLAVKDMIWQEFLPQVRTDGEWSLMFFDGAFSHAVVKRPVAGDFRVQNDFGGTSAAAAPPAGWVEAARRILARAPVQPVYARIDFVAGAAADGEASRIPLLMELEVIEPALFLSLAHGAAAVLAEALLRPVDAPRSSV
jgi:hypothetical protein